jgi:hypothetical protein
MSMDTPPATVLATCFAWCDAEVRRRTSHAAWVRITRPARNSDCMLGEVKTFASMYDTIEHNP